MFFCFLPSGSTWRTTKGLKIDSDETIVAQQEDMTNDAEQSFYFVIQYTSSTDGSNASVIDKYSSKRNSIMYPIEV